jgi:MoaA/NifB/PqqE/SkfB family radical SAM enzyme
MVDDESYGQEHLRVSCKYLSASSISCIMISHGKRKMQDRHKEALESSLWAISIELSTYCNLACRMCSVWKRRKHGAKYEKVISLLDEARTLGATCFGPCGAEPFIREDLIDIMAYAESIGYQEINVVSNGLLLNDRQRMDKLEKLRNLILTISIDGPRDVHDELRGKGVYKEAVEVLRELRRRGITCGVSSVIMRQTLDRLNEIVDLAAEMGICTISMQPYSREFAGADNDHSVFEFRVGEEEMIMKKLENLMRYAKSKRVSIYTANMMEWVPRVLTRRARPIPPDGCFVPSKRLVVDVSGETSPCFMLKDALPARSMGNVNQMSLDGIWHNAIHRELTLLGLHRKCVGCLAACSDVESYNALAKRSRLAGLLARLRTDEKTACERSEESSE